MSEVVEVRNENSNETWTETEGDEEVNKQIEDQEENIEDECSDGSCISVPSSNLLQVKVSDSKLELIFQIRF